MLIADNVVLSCANGVSRPSRFCAASADDSRWRSSAQAAECDKGMKTLFAALALTKHAIRCLVFVALALFLGCATARTNQPISIDSPGPADQEQAYILGPGDRIDVKFPYKSEFNESLPVRPDGFVSLQLIGDVRAAGLTPPELALTINQRYEGLIRNPHTTVIVREFASQRMYVGGEVRDPGPIALQGSLTCLQAVLARGGATRSANLRQVLLIRYSGENTASVCTLDLKRVMHGEEADVVLRPYDVVHVPMTAIAQAGEFVEQYINKLVPRALMFPYDLNTRVDVNNTDDAALRR